jgi:cytochrome c oxidase cbb3-type subunit 3
MTGPTNDDRQDKILEHSYDGIQEYDNPMPRWWLLTFAATIIFSVIYYFNVGPVGIGKGRIAEYEADMQTFAAAHPAPSGGEMSEAQLVALTTDHEELEEGQETYVAYCSACHRADGGGLIGPNLTDAYWLHGGRITDLYATVTNGVLEKGMPPWGKTLKPKQLAAVVAYVATLKGSNPKDPKPPQGTVVTP